MKRFLHFLMYFIIGIAGLFAAVAIILKTLEYLILYIVSKNIVGFLLSALLISLEVAAVNYLVNYYHGE